MDISANLASLSATNLLASSTALVDSRDVGEQADSGTVGQRHDHKGPQGRALGIFQREMRMALQATFHAKFAAQQQGYASVQDAPNADDVAADALQTANQLTAESPTNAASSLVMLQAKVHETATYVREIVSAEENLQAIDDAVANIDAGISQLEDEVATNVESSASVLEIDTSTKLQSAIRIRTQEGDMVKLSLKQFDSLSATDTADYTEISMSSQSRLMLKVNGDLSEAELTAIQNVFAQAEQIANEFFGGDLAAAFESAEGFEFDMEQLARVNLRFKMQQATEISYAGTIGSGERLIEPDSAPQVETAVSQFLRAIGDGFAQSSGEGSFRLHYSESFKLELLRAVIHVAAPESSETATTDADAVIEQLSETVAE